jgi:galactose mutarotase-like enzyme
MTTAVGSRLVRLDNGDCRALVYPEQGFQLRGFATTVAGRAGGAPIEAMFSPADAREPADRRHGNPILFPSVGVTHGAETDRWSHGGRLLTMPQHGWARDAYWHVEAIDARSVTGVLAPTTGIRSGFPFSFDLRLRYALEGTALVLSAELANRGDEPFPYAFGLHPYLRAPLVAASGRANCKVRLPAGVRLRSSDSWRTIERAPVTASIITAADAELPGSIVLAETGATAFEVEDGDAGIATRVSVEGSDTDYPIWVVWSASPDAPYVCLEPWTDVPNALNRPGTRTLAAGATHRYRMTISLRPL